MITVIGQMYTGHHMAAIKTAVCQAHAYANLSGEIWTWALLMKIYLKGISTFGGISPASGLPNLAKLHPPPLS